MHGRRLASRLVGLLGLALGIGCATVPSTHAELPAPVASASAGYRSQVYEVSPAGLATALAAAGPTRRVQRVGWRVDAAPSSNCHSQGVTFGRDRVITSCTDRTRGVGWLQVFEGEALQHHADGGAARLARAVRLYEGDWPHPAVGQAVYGTGALAGRLLIPVVNESLDRQDDAPRGGAVIDLRDGDGELVCAIRYPDSGGLASAALSVHDGRLWLTAISGSHVFVYRIDDPTPGTTACRAQRVFAAAGVDITDAPWRRYQGIVVFENPRGEVFLLGGRKHHLDAWQVVGLGTNAMTWTHLGRMRWRPAAVGRHGVFHEGLALVPGTDGHVRLWALPHDYWRHVCRTSDPDVRCTRAIYARDLSLVPAGPGQPW